MLTKTRPSSNMWIVGMICITAILLAIILGGYWYLGQTVNASFAARCGGFVINSTALKAAALQNCSIQGNVQIPQGAIIISGLTGR